MAIRYLTYQQIDKARWNICIGNADNGLIYGYSFYLDTMAKHWDALVLDDYAAVMPLTWNKKYSIHYLYQPPFTACLGVFGEKLDAVTLAAFLKAVPAKFKYWDVCFNPGNCFEPAGFNLYLRMNYVLKLNADYEVLYAAYRDNIKRNIKKAVQYGLTIRRNIPVSDIIQLSKEQAKPYAVKEDDLIRFEKLYQLLYKNEKATSYAVYTKEGRLVASAVFLFSHNRAYYILVGNHADGKTLGASHALIDAFVKDHAGQDLLLDFEGSDVPSLAFFYSSFGAVEEKYSAVKLNRLPFFLKRLKKIIPVLQPV